MCQQFSKNFESLKFQPFQQAQEQSKGYFLKLTHDAQIEETVFRRKTYKFWFIISKLKFKLSKFLFYFSEKIHDF